MNMVPSIGPVRYKNLKDHFGNIADVFSAELDELISVDGISETTAKAIMSAGGRRTLAEKEIDSANANGIEILELEDVHYPSLLKMIPDPPPILYCKGDKSVLNRASVALVGSRKSTPYGEKVAEKLSRELAEYDVVTVSGLARGIDTAVHRAAVQAKGKTVAVLGSGLLRVYPPENKKLAEEIAFRGAVLSEFPLNTPPDAGNFPRRNRIIAGMSLGTVVVEADERSGSLITAKLAAEQGKDIFAVPGPIFSKTSRGTHMLIKQGAKLVESCRDIMEEINNLKGLAEASVAGGKIRDEKGSGAFIPVLSPEEEIIFDFVDFEPVHIDVLSSKSALGSGEFSRVLLNLELKGAVKALPGKMYVRN